MCRVEERVYIGAEGHRSIFEERFPCDKSRNGKFCSRVKKKTLEYHTKSGSVSRDNTPSPGNPPTPTGTGAYVVQQRRPSSSGGRPFTRDGHKPIAPEITINFNSKKDNGKRNSGVTVSTKPHKRSSLMTSPIDTSDLIDDFPGSDGSHTIRTGFPDAPLPTPTAFGHPDSFITSPSHGYHNCQTSSTSSFNAPSSTPSLYVTSDPDYESPDTRRGARPAPTIIQHQTSATPTSSAPRPSAMKPSVPYRTALVAPRTSAHDGDASDLFPLDYGDLADRSASSHASSVAPENTRKGKDRDERRRKQEEERRREEERIRRAAEEAARENAKQVRFELDRPAARERERAEKMFAEKEVDRALAREEARRQDEEARRRERKEREKKEREEEETKQRKKKEREEEEVKQRKKEKRSSAIKQDDKSTTRTRRSTMTQDQIAEQRHLLAAEQRRMEDEKQVAMAREREEQNALLRQQQDTREYFDPRGGNRSLDRRASISRQPPPMPASGLVRSGSHRHTSVHQSNPPVIANPVLPDYSTRPSNVRQKTGPPVSFPSNFNQNQGYERPPSTRRPSYSQEALPSARVRRDSGAATGNPFVQDSSVLSPSHASADPWDLRTVQSALPNCRPAREARSNTIQQRGQEVINRSVSQAQQATRAMYQDVNVFDDDSEDEFGAYAGRLRRKH